MFYTFNYYFLCSQSDAVKLLSLKSIKDSEKILLVIVSFRCLSEVRLIFII